MVETPMLDPLLLPHCRMHHSLGLPLGILWPTLILGFDHHFPFYGAGVGPSSGCGAKMRDAVVFRCMGRDISGSLSLGHQ